MALNISQNISQKSSGVLKEDSSIAEIATNNVLEFSSNSEDTIKRLKKIQDAVAYVQEMQFFLPQDVVYKKVPSNAQSKCSMLSARTIRRRLQQSGLSARRPLLVLPLTQNHRRLRRQWCDERRIWVAEWNEVVFTNEPCFCQQHHDGRIQVWRHGGERMLNSVQCTITLV
ncbi:transposable element Tcb1 transposase [Trichonephila clavipes]|nr:transposable element Tcb1 transposase [Trichonephila clavipes]